MTNWRDKWQHRTRGGYEVVNVYMLHGLLRASIKFEGSRHPGYAVDENGKAISHSHKYDLLPITPPAEPVPPSDIAKYEAELSKCADIVQRHHPIGAVKGIGLMEVATGLEELMQDLAGRRRDVERLEAENKKLRKIAAHVPPRIYIKAKEDAGFGTAVVTDWMVQDETVDPVESRMVRLINGIKSLRRYVLVKGFAQSVDDAKSIGFAYDASQWGFVANPECDPYEALEECEKWLHGKLDALISIATKPAAVDALPDPAT